MWVLLLECVGEVGGCCCWSVWVKWEGKVCG